jgi:hypothetical protein
MPPQILLDAFACARCEGVTAPTDWYLYKGSRFYGRNEREHDLGQWIPPVLH